MARVLLLIPTTSYKTADFMAAAEALGVEPVVGTDRRQALESLAPGGTLALDLVRSERGLRAIREFHVAAPFAAVVGTDDETTVLAALAAEALGLPHNPPGAVAAARDKYAMRCRLRDAGLPGPHFRLVDLDGTAAAAARAVGYPCVIKPRGLSASRGVLRCDDPASLAAAFDRVRDIVRRAGDRGVDRRTLLVESYLPGPECTVEGLLAGGELSPLAIFDKPDPMAGPTFEETLFVTPSRMSSKLARRTIDAAAAACAALGLREGPVHVELRRVRGVPTVLEVAPRTIGGLCARTLRIGTGMALEEIVLRHALGMTFEPPSLPGAVGVSMIPVRTPGVLAGIDGVEAARAVDGVVEVTMTLHRGDELVPLPEGNRYAGFVFAKAGDPEDVERILREATRLIELRS